MASGASGPDFSEACAKPRLRVGFSKPMDVPSPTNEATIAVPGDNEGGTSGPVRLRTIVLIRWVAVAGQAMTLIVVHYGLGFGVLLAPAFAVVGASVLLNLAVTL